MGTSSPPWSSEKLSQGGAGVKSLPRHLNPPGIAAGGESAEGGRRREPQSTWLARVGGGWGALVEGDYSAGAADSPRFASWGNAGGGEAPRFCSGCCKMKVVASRKEAFLNA